jgi:hypothetical protein
MQLTHSLCLVRVGRCLLTTWKPRFEKVLTKVFYGFMVDFRAGLHASPLECGRSGMAPVHDVRPFDRALCSVGATHIAVHRIARRVAWSHACFGEARAFALSLRMSSSKGARVSASPQGVL